MTVYADTVVNIAKTEIGGEYVYGGKGNPSNPHPNGLDCSGLITWAVDRAGGSFPNGSVEQEEYCRAHGTIVTIEEAEATVGALLFIRTAVEQHVVLTLGNGTNIQAHDSAEGIGIYPDSRDIWTAAARIPGLYYGPGPVPPAPGKPLARLLYLTDPYMTGADVGSVQQALKAHGFDVAVDDVYGPLTEGAVVVFQHSRGLYPDGVVGPLTVAAGL